MRRLIVTVFGAGMVIVHAMAVSAEAPRVAQAASGEKAADSKAKMPGEGVVGAVTVRGTISAIDAEKGTVTLKGPKGRTLTLEVKDKSKFDVIKVGDPVVATYVEAVAIQVAKSGAPAVSTQESRVTSKPGETPAGAIGRQITVTAPIVSIDNKAHTVTIKGPDGATETIKVKRPENLQKVKPGDLVDITYTQALAVSLDKPAK